jgi:hypothetical protein
MPVPQIPYKTWKQVNETGRMPVPQIPYKTWKQVNETGRMPVPQIPYKICGYSELVNVSES